MHPCLQSPEIVQLVVRNLWDGHEPDAYAPIVTVTPMMPASTRTSLARLARTCRAFQSHALDALWCRQVGIENLLRCMPGSLVSERRGFWGPKSQGKKLMLCFAKAVASSDWSRFDFYARRVKAMKFRLDPSHTIVTRSVYKALVMYDEHPRPYLPNLIQLICELSTSECSSEMLSFCLALLGPSVRVLRLERGEDMISAPFVLSCSRHLARSIQHLEFALDFSPETLVLLEESLKSLHQLRVLSLTLLGPLRFGIWKALSESSTLAELTILTSRGTSIIPTRVSLETPELVNLPHLTHLTLRGVNPAGCLHLLSRCSFPNIECMNIDIPATASWDHIDLSAHDANFLRGVSAAFSPSLRELTLSSSPGISSDQLAHLHTFPGMTRFIVNISSDPDDGVVQDIARAWPFLQTLRLVRDKPNTNHPLAVVPTAGVTPNGLANLVRACPHLRELALQLDMRGFELSTQRPWSDSTNSHVTVLEVGTSLMDPATPALHIAAFLTDLFPNLVALKEDGKLLTGKWSEVSQSLEAFRVARAQERQRAMSRDVVRDPGPSGVGTERPLALTKR